MRNSKLKEILANWTDAEKKVAVKGLVKVDTCQEFYIMMKRLELKFPNKIQRLTNYLDFYDLSRLSPEYHDEEWPDIDAYNRLLSSMLWSENYEYGKEENRGNPNIESHEPREQVIEESYQIIFDTMFSFLYKRFDLGWGDSPYEEVFYKLTDKWDPTDTEYDSLFEVKYALWGINNIDLFTDDELNEISLREIGSPEDDE